MKVKEESEKVILKLNIQKTKIMASDPITSWQIDGETVETMAHFIFLGSKITADGDCSHEIKGRLLLVRKVMTILDSILKSRDITLLTKFCVVNYGFSSSHIGMWELDYKESWALLMLLNCSFWTVVLDKTLLRVAWTARKSNQSILKEISPEHSLEGLMLKLKVQYSGHLMGRADSFEKTLMLGKIEGRRRGDDRGWDGWIASPTQWRWVWVDSRSWWWTGRPGVLWFMGSQRAGHDWATVLNWTVGNQGKCARYLLLVLHAACGILVPWPVIEPLPLQRKHGSSGKFWDTFFLPLSCTTGGQLIWTATLASLASENQKERRMLEGKVIAPELSPCQVSMDWLCSLIKGPSSCTHMYICTQPSPCFVTTPSSCPNLGSEVILGAWMFLSLLCDLCIPCPHLCLWPLY